MQVALFIVSTIAVGLTIALILVLVYKKKGSSKLSRDIEHVVRVVSIYEKYNVLLLNGLLEGEIDIGKNTPPLLQNVKEGDKLYLSSTKPDTNNIKLKLMGVLPYVVGINAIGDPSWPQNDNMFDEKGNFDLTKYSQKFCPIAVNNTSVKTAYHFSDSNINVYVYMGSYMELTSKTQNFGTPIYPLGKILYLWK